MDAKIEEIRELCHAVIEAPGMFTFSGDDGMAAAVLGIIER